MKKLMIVAAVVLTAAVSQAMAVTWATGKFYDVDADGKWTGTTAYDARTDIASLVITAYLYDSTGKTLLGTGSLSGTGSQLFANAGSAISKQNFLDADGNVVTVDAKTFYMAKIVMTGDFGNGGTQSFTATDMVQVKSPDNGAFNVAFGSAPKIIDTTKTQWTAAPEPTSGLLLLLGVGALALRRRRA